MKRTLFWFCILLLTQACQAQSTADDFALGEKALDDGNTAAAIQHFDAVLKQQPRQERALVLRSKAKYQQQDYEGSRKDSQLVLDINPAQFTPEDYNALWNLGVIHNSLRQFAKARVYFGRMKQADSTDVRAYEHIGYSYLQERNYPAALTEFEQAVQVSPSAKTSFYGIGKAHIMQGHFEQAVQAYDQAIKLDPNYATAYENRAAAKYQLQDLVGCCADLQRCLDLGMTQVAEFQKQVCR
ncbi:tetratricopeptide repeat protein [Hymenobacter puniceus]|uniref:tetratricopeptide repeat protein n=1 Tax=Hymenobacter sp. BT190 TaxID=2763505 RepID=UPI0016510210|nr:tetratricopeptide repeat protein [Hymenobacter sp. BT190]MBC6699868.1 tetratricopeptide repeat protein [Hymenobacter sp. BT190]